MNEPAISEDAVAQSLPTDPGLPAVDLWLEYHGMVPREHLYLATTRISWRSMRGTPHF
ncbi:hypothetical protein TPY_0542 [Sulfobacillus acidophilus TPY]|uniref:Uncharacterized protein n=1 Tax=Sulfobacillus acidophilus (strain ATCC 700253 / DSM 10332 / NAL) TaxID=679936 RepID=G8U1Q2_SULAD|nr:hypothetical protein TPY_0542 [Sulfobacillus acidophilus TPY]AEW06980.1 hypothetical protein Sulac_3546 [Sulfobacillus acidophilus DSM 10332]